MSKEKILHYLNAKSEYTANINLLNYTDQQASISFNNDGVTLYVKGSKKILKYNSFTQEDFDKIVDSTNE